VFSGITNFYIADVVNAPIFLSNIRLFYKNYDYPGCYNRIDITKHIYLPLGSNIKFYAAQAGDDCTTMSLPPLSNSVY
jgi:hypothetical protein